MKWVAVVVGALTTLVMVGCSGKPSPDALARKILEASTPEEQERAAVALSDLGLVAVPQMRELASNSSLPLRVKFQMFDGLVSAKDLDSVPILIEAMESDSAQVRSRASGSVMRLLGAQFPFQPDAPAQTRRQQMQAIRAECEKLRDHPPPGYHSTRAAAAS